MIEIITFITTLLSLFCAGGWFVNYKAKKRADMANSNKVELSALTDNLTLTKLAVTEYQQAIISSMSGHEQRHDTLDKNIAEIFLQLKKIDMIEKYLNGEYLKFKTE
jgi:poly(3-hydroxyalkanoate) synthetase